MPDIARTLATLFEAERTLRNAHAELTSGDRKELLSALESETRSALKTPGEEATLRLVRIAPLLSEVEGPLAADLLIDILASDDPEARHAAGVSLEDVAYDRFKEVALAIERAVERLPVGSPALSELPFLLAEVAEPGCVKLLGRFLQHADPEAVAAAIEALAELGDDTAVPLLAKLERDARQVDLDEEGDSGRVSIGELAQEARQLLEEVAAAEGRDARGGGGRDRRRS